MATANQQINHSLIDPQKIQLQMCRYSAHTGDSFKNDTPKITKNLLQVSSENTLQIIEHLKQQDKYRPCLMDYNGEKNSTFLAAAAILLCNQNYIAKIDGKVWTLEVLIEALKYSNDIQYLIQNYPASIDYSTKVIASSTELVGWGFSYFKGEDADLYEISIAHLLSKRKFFETTLQKNPELLRLEIKKVSATSHTIVPMTVPNLLHLSGLNDSAVALYDQNLCEVDLVAIAYSLKNQLASPSYIRYLYILFLDVTCCKWICKSTGDTMLHYLSGFAHAFNSGLETLVVSIIDKFPRIETIRNKKGQSISAIALTNRCSLVIDVLQARGKLDYAFDIISVFECFTRPLVDRELLTEILATYKIEVVDVSHISNGNPKILRASLFHLLIPYPEFLRIFLEILNPPNDFQNKIMDALMTVKHENANLELTGLDFAAKFDIPCQSIQILIRDKDSLRSKYFTDQLREINDNPNQDWRAVSQRLLFIWEHDTTHKITIDTKLRILNCMLKCRITSSEASLEVFGDLLKDFMLTSDLDDASGNSLVQSLARYHSDSKLFRHVVEAKQLNLFKKSVGGTTILHTFAHFVPFYIRNDFDPVKALKLFVERFNISTNCRSSISDVLFSANAQFESLFTVLLARCLLIENASSMAVLIYFDSILELHDSKSAQPDMKYWLVNTCRQFPIIRLGAESQELNIEQWSKYLRYIHLHLDFNFGFMVDGKTAFDFILANLGPQIPLDFLNLLASIGAKSSSDLRCINESNVFEGSCINLNSNDLSITDKTGRSVIHRLCHESPLPISEFRMKIDDLIASDFGMLIFSIDNNLLSPIMYSIINDAINYTDSYSYVKNLDKISERSKYLLGIVGNWTQKYCDNPVFTLLHRLKSQLRGHFIGNLMSAFLIYVYLGTVWRFVRYLNVDINDLDEQGDTLVDNWRSIESEMTSELFECGLKSLREMESLATDHFVAPVVGLDWSTKDAAQVNTKRRCVQVIEALEDLSKRVRTEIPSDKPGMMESNLYDSDDVIPDLFRNRIFVPRKSEVVDIINSDVEPPCIELSAVEPDRIRNLLELNLHYSGVIAPELGQAHFLAPGQTDFVMDSGELSSDFDLLLNTDLRMPNEVSASSISPSSNLTKRTKIAVIAKADTPRSNVANEKGLFSNENTEPRTAQSVQKRTEKSTQFVSKSLQIYDFPSNKTYLLTDTFLRSVQKTSGVAIEIEGPRAILRKEAPSMARSVILTLNGDRSQVDIATLTINHKLKARFFDKESNGIKFEPWTFKFPARLTDQWLHLWSLECGLEYEKIGPDADGSFVLKVRYVEDGNLAVGRKILMKFLAMDQENDSETRPKASVASRNPAVARVSVDPFSLLLSTEVTAEFLEDAALGRLEMLLFEQCSELNDLVIMKLVGSGAQISALDPKYSRYPLHFYLIALSQYQETIRDEHLKIVKKLMDPMNPTRYIDAMDSSGSSPLTIMIFHDLYAYIEKCKSRVYYDANINASIITNFFLQMNGALRTTDEHECTAFHYLASIIFSERQIAGVRITGQKKQELIQPQHFALFVRYFILWGKLEPNALNSKKETGLDVLIKRWSSKEFSATLLQLNVSKEEFASIISDLRNIKCRQAHEIRIVVQ